MLARQEIEYPRTHNIAMLVELLRTNGLPLPPRAEELPRLVPYGVTLRYDDCAAEEAVHLDRAWATNVVSAIIAWDTAHLEKETS